jgi:hypothetical protein
MSLRLAAAASSGSCPLARQAAARRHRSLTEKMRDQDKSHFPSISPVTTRHANSLLVLTQRIRHRVKLTLACRRNRAICTNRKQALAKLSVRSGGSRSG